MAAALHGHAEDAALLLADLDEQARDAALAEAVVIAADLLTRLARGPGVPAGPVAADAELAVLCTSVRSALLARLDPRSDSE